MSQKISDKESHVAVLGAGMYGMAMAVALSNNTSINKKIVVWARDKNTADDINNNHRNSKYFKGFEFNKSILASSDIERAVSDATAVLVAVPAQNVRIVLELARDYLPSNAPIIICSKGIEQQTNMLMTQVVDEVLPEHGLVVLSGPALAGEIVRGLPTCLTVASSNFSTAQEVSMLIKSDNMMTQICQDPLGVEICSALKNVTAIAAGVAYGLGLGENASSAIATFGLIEAQQIVTVLGGDKETVLTQAGVGDLMLTAGSLNSRNTSFGIEIGSGDSPQEIIKKRQDQGIVTEGYWTAPAVLKIVNNLGIEAPVSRAVAKIINGAPPKPIIESLFKS